MNNKDTRVIPRGFYCYTMVDGKQVNCPYWGIDPSLPEQENGTCSFLEINDYDENVKINSEIKITGGASGDVGKTVAEVFGDHFPSSLLWDQCKECGINDYTDEEIGEMFVEELNSGRMTEIIDPSESC